MFLKKYYINVYTLCKYTFLILLEKAILGNYLKIFISKYCNLKCHLSTSYIFIYMN